MIREPGRTEGQRVSAPAQLSDLYPTVLRAALGESLPGSGYGVQDLLAPAGGDPAERVAIAQYRGPFPKVLDRIREIGDPEVIRRAVPQVAAVDGRYKYIASRDGRRELYDILADPGETRDLVALRPNQAKRLADYIATWRANVPRYQPAEAEEAPEMRPETIRALRALGYLDGE
jgi:arylsulfatase A-like enzyme